MDHILIKGGCQKGSIKKGNVKENENYAEHTKVDWKIEKKRNRKRKV